MDRYLGTKHWDKRFNLDVLGVVCVDAYLYFQQVVGASNRTTSCLKFFGRHADKLNDNQEGIRITRAAADPDPGGNGATHAAEPTVWKTIKMKHTPGTAMRMGRGAIRTRRGRRDFNAMGGDSDSGDNNAQQLHKIKFTLYACFFTFSFMWRKRRDGTLNHQISI